MSTLRDLSLSLIEYRPSVFRRGGSIPLGVVLAGTTGRMAFVVLEARTSLSPGEAEQLDPIGRELLTNPFKFLNDQLRSALPGTKSPHEALANFSEKNQWSIFVSAPRPREVKRGVLEITKLLTLRRILNETYRLHQAGFDPFATTVHSTPKPAPRGVGFSKLDPSNMLWANKEPPLTLSIGA